MIGKWKAKRVGGYDPCPPKDKAAVALGRKGGKARAASLSKEQRSAIASKAAWARWHFVCDRCLKYFAKHICTASTLGECDCPQCQGLCECSRARG